MLEARVRAPTTTQRDALRARIVLLAGEGRSTRSIADELGVMPNTVSTWRARYAGEGLAGLADKPRPGPKPKYTAETGQRILAVLEGPPPAGFGRWIGPLIAAELGDVHEQQVWRFLRDQRIDLDGKKSWCESDDAEFAAKAADVVGLYMAPPENAIVICVDEKPSIQALERAQGYLRLPNGRALCGHSHDYKRHGTTTLFAALDLATGKVAAAHKKRRRRVEFLAFMDEIVALYPDKEIHVVLDNLNTHKKNEGWLRLIPTSTSTSRRPGRPGSTRSRSGSPSLPANRCAAPPSPRSTNSGSTSMPSSTLQSTCIPIRLDQARGPPASLQGPPYQSIVIPGTSSSTQRL